MKFKFLLSMLYSTIFFFACDDDQKDVKIKDLGIFDQFVVKLPDQSIIVPDQNVPTQDQAIQDQTIQDQTIQDQAIQDQTIQDQAIQDQAIQDQAIQDQAIQDQAIQDQAIQDQAIQDQAIQDQAMIVRDQDLTNPDLSVNVDMQVLLPSEYLVINEIDYDQEMTDTREYIEIYNPSNMPIDLRNYRLDLINGAAFGDPGEIYNSIFFRDAVSANTSAAMLPAGAYFVIIAPALEVELIQSNHRYYQLFALAEANIQNAGGSGDGIRLIDVRNEQIIDTVCYGPRVVGLNEGDGRIDNVDSNDPNVSVSRCPNGQDSNQNRMDFKIPTPTSLAGPNICLP
jgi:hypothetical protein